MEKQLTHVAGTFIIQADAAFLNGAGPEEYGEDRNVTVPKTFWDGNKYVPYVSSQAWKRWLRTTFIQETGWPSSELKAIGWNPKGNVNKIAGELNPVEIPEDDIFGYMRAEEGQGKRASEDEEDKESEDAEAAPAKKTKSLIRAAPFMASVLFPIPLSVGIGKDRGFVHLTKYDPQSLAEAEVERYLSTAIDKKASKKKQSAWKKLEEVDEELYKSAKKLADENELDELRKMLAAKAGDTKVKFIENACSPLPYSTKFYSSSLQGIFCLNYSRLGVYWNLGDRIELEETKAKKLIADGLITEVTKEDGYKHLTENGKVGKVYKVTDRVKPPVKERASALFNALSVLRGGAKQAQFGTDISPKVMIMAGLSCGNPIFNNLFTGSLQGPILKIDTLKELIKDYSDRITTPVIIGIRAGYLGNESEVKDLDNSEKEDKSDKKDVKVLVMTPLEAAQKMGNLLP